MIDINSVEIASGIESLIDFIFKNKEQIIILCVSSDIGRQKVSMIMEENRLHSLDLHHFRDLLSHKSGIFIAKLYCHNPWSFANVIFIPDRIIINHQHYIESDIKKPYIPTKSIDVGQLVIYKKYGIGKFLGFEIISINNRSHEYAKIGYHNEDKIYLPIEDLNQIQPYEDVLDNEITLDSLKKDTWQRKIASTKSTIQEIAYKIISIAAKRKQVIGNIYNKEARLELIRKMESFFPFIETLDQSKAIDEVYSDLSSGKVMDRLICGDVGFGKTEIAIRAMFLVTCGKLCNQRHRQVVLLCPATFLVQQHYNTISKRFVLWNIKVAMLSRFTSDRDSKRIKSELKNGEIDIIIATHSILSDDISFHSLDLIICDEEQLFGVEHKEKLKELAPSAHVLTLTATPIPRTLQTAMCGIRDISVLTTPPYQRTSISTLIIDQKQEIIKSIIEYEKRSNGMTIIITPRIGDIDELMRYIESIVQNYRTRILHGSMKRAEMDDTMLDIYEGKCDILIATTIAVCGMDFGNSNTMIINKPEMFGLSQLHQIRGRVGRRDKQAYCYLMLDERTISDKEKSKRAIILQNISNLGSGLEIAKMDLSIRGGGNTLGEEQSGTIHNIGSELYYELLHEEINNQSRIEKDSTNLIPDVNISKSIYIPQTYIENPKLRIEFYRRIANISSHDEWLTTKAEMINRFGDIPEELNSLFELIEIRQLCKKYKIRKLILDKKYITIAPKTDTVNLQNLLSIVNKTSQVTIGSDDTIRIRIDEFKERESITVREHLLIIDDVLRGT